LTHPSTELQQWRLVQEYGEKALLKSLLTPWTLLKEAQDSYDYTKVLVLQEEIKTLPRGEVWDEYLKLEGMASDADMFLEVRERKKNC